MLDVMLGAVLGRREEHASRIILGFLPAMPFRHDMYRINVVHSSSLASWQLRPGCKYPADGTTPLILNSI